MLEASLIGVSYLHRGRGKLDETRLEMTFVEHVGALP
jgi:hypothetical protein